jgi:hypothetical protein
MLSGSTKRLLMKSLCGLIGKKDTITFKFTDFKDRKDDF